ncbi:MAG: hypothetical protein KUG59_07145 [Parvibaculaceae bacterium]|nr:hypothetical protein [Parvibaculaceae bacterium]
MLGMRWARIEVGEGLLDVGDQFASSFYTFRQAPHLGSPSEEDAGCAWIVAYDWRGIALSAGLHVYTRWLDNSVDRFSYTAAVATAVDRLG